ncbi:MAG: type II toxin-antitoxin system HicB family antitoxin [Aeromicrobium sp.]|nr:MAG: type II toxin-antitoxin system HicB family antitoxin [Aeromicrobium sp.]
MSYTVLITREGDAWLADVPEVAGAHTHARSIDVLLKSIREVIVLMDDLPDDARIDFSLEFDLNDELVERAFRLGQARAELTAREALMAEQTSVIVSELVGRGFTVRDAARLLDMTPGRVSQIANA